MIRVGVALIMLLLVVNTVAAFSGGARHQVVDLRESSTGSAAARTVLQQLPAASGGSTQVVLDDPGGAALVRVVVSPRDPSCVGGIETGGPGEGSCPSRVSSSSVPGDGAGPAMAQVTSVADGFRVRASVWGAVTPHGLPTRMEVPLTVADLQRIAQAPRWRHASSTD